MNLKHSLNISYYTARPMQQKISETLSIFMYKLNIFKINYLFEILKKFAMVLCEQIMRVVKPVLKLWNKFK
jgi:hypothetical protein